MEGCIFNTGVKIKAILGYGITMFDCNLDFERDSIDFCDIWEKLWDITKQSEFIEFCDLQEVMVREWKEEDCTQMWLVFKPYYIETTNLELFGQMEMEKANVIKKIEEVKNKLFLLLEEQTGWKASYDDSPQWGLHLHYN